MLYPILFLILASYTVLGSPSILTNLEYTNPMLQELRKEVKENLKASKSAFASNTIKPLKYYKYQVKEDDGFFEIMSRTGMDLDTLSSVNELSSPHDIYVGQVLEVPNMRGIFYSDRADSSSNSRKKISEEFRIPPEILQFDSSRGKWFLPGIRLSRKEKSFVDGTGFLRPLKAGFMSSGFGKRLDPFSKKETFHGGIDIAASLGTSVYASQEGIVDFQGYSGNYGNLIILKHGLGYETRYGHLSKFQVKAGDLVKKGEIIGAVGSTGKSTGPHLHFEVIRNSKRQKPIFRNH